MDITPEAYLEDFVTWNGDTFESRVARQLLPHVQRLGEDGFTDYIRLRLEELGAAYNLQDGYWRKRNSKADPSS